MLPDKTVLKRFRQEDFYQTTLPAFIELGPIEDFGNDAVAGYNELLAFTSSYAWEQSVEITNEATFKGCIRIQPMMTEVFGKIAKDRLAPWSSHSFNDNPQLVSGCRKVVSAISKAFTAAYGSTWGCTSIQLPTLMPEAQISIHVDGYLAYLWSEKIHLPLITNSKSRNVTFNITNGEITYTHLDVGKLYIINNLEPHAAFNFGDTPRAHLIFDMFDIQKHQELKAMYGASQNLYLTDVPGLGARNLQFAANSKLVWPNLTSLYQDYLTQQL